MENKLISMTDFIEEQEKIIPYEESGTLREWDRIYVKRTIDYCRFLKLPLALGFFIPCDGSGNILVPYEKEPLKEDYWSDNSTVYSGELYAYNLQNYKTYQKAKEQVVFICNKIEHYEDCIVFNELFYYSKELKNFRPWLNRRFVKDGIIDTIEELIPCELKITPETAKKLELS